MSHAEMLLKDDYEPLDDSVFHDMEDIVFSLESKLSDIKFTLDKMINMQGISKGMMLGLEDALPSNTSINSYTAQPTLTNFRQTVVSLENLAVKIFNSIIKAIMEFFKKIITWVTKLTKGKRSFKNLDDTKSAEKAFDEILNASEEHSRIDTLNSVREKVNTKYESMWNAYSEACAVNPSHEMIEFFKIGEFVYNDLLDEVTKVAKHLKDISEDGPSPEHVSGNMFETINKAIDITIINGFSSMNFPTLKLSDGEAIARLDDFTAKYKSYVSSMKNRPSENQYDIGSVSKTLVDSKGTSGVSSKVLKPYLHVDSKVIDKLKDLQKIIYGISGSKFKSLDNLRLDRLKNQIDIDAFGDGSKFIEDLKGLLFKLQKISVFIGTYTGERANTINTENVQKIIVDGYLAKVIELSKK
ncbi:MAG: hypothetical protein IBX57_00300 [Gammaproteobacteria bacterium]|nr:hypothetical protein [Gammaproteobacteria bacterium]